MLVTMFAACSKKEDESSAPASSDVYESAEGLVDENGDPVERETEGIVFDEEDDEAELEYVQRDPSDFIGEWTATSDKATYLYGNIDITVNADGTWSGDITGEQLGGKWEQEGDRLHMNDELFSFDLAFESSGKLILIETGEDANFNTVLTKK